MIAPSPYYSLREAASYVRLTYKSLCNLRTLGLGPPAVSARGKPLFRRIDLDNWLESRGRVPANRSRR